MGNTQTINVPQCTVLQGANLRVDTQIALTEDADNAVDFIVIFDKNKNEVQKIK